MLLANQSVAAKLYQSFPHLAVLRRHQRPDSAMLDSVAEELRDLGFHVNASSSRSLHESLAALRTKLDPDLMSLIVALCTKPMKTAEYLCTGALEEDADFGHYALSFPFYTHFTSPIRRYPDVLVHRLLQAALELERDVEGPALQRVLGLDAALQDKICKHANQKKSNAKQAQEQSDKIHMCVMLRAKPMEVCATPLGSPSRPRRPELTERVGAAG